jgi:hypothetical protein
MKCEGRDPGRIAPLLFMMSPARVTSAYFVNGQPLSFALG